MATIFIPKGRNTFYISYFVNGKRITKNTNIPENEKEEAKKLKEKFEAKIQPLSDIVIAETLANNTNNLKLSDAIKNFIDYYKVNWSNGRYNNVITTLKIFSEFLNGVGYVSDINSLNISEFITKRKDNVSVTTVRSDLNVLSTFFNYLLEENLIKKSPINRKLIPKPEHKNITTFDLKSIELILSSVKLSDPLFHKYLFLLSATGARPGDILRLTYGNIDIINDILRIKIQKTTREINFPMYKVLRNFVIDEFPELKDCDPSELIFKDYKIPMEGKKFKSIKNKLELNSSFNLKTFRKSFATKLIDEGIDGLVVAYLLGHISVNTTTKYYINKKANVIRNSLNNIKFLE